MTYTLLTDLNQIVKEENEYKTHYETVAYDFFGCDLEDLEKMAKLWADAKEPKEPTTLTEINAARGRHIDRGWLQQAKDEYKTKRDPSTSLGIKSNHKPKVGNKVVLGNNNMGTIAGVEPVDNLVSIKDNRTGEEKVFKFDELTSPTMVNSEMAWKLKV